MNLTSRYHRNHQWVGSKSHNDLRLEWTCTKCGMLVETPLKNRPSSAVARVVNGVPLRSIGLLPPCEVVAKHGGKKQGKEPRRPRNNVSQEWQEILGVCVYHLGTQWVRDWLRLGKGDLTDAQQIELTRLHAALRVHLTDAVEEVAIVGQQIRRRQKDQVVAMAMAGWGGM